MKLRYETTAGLEICTVNMDDKDNPVKFSKYFPSLNTNKIIKEKGIKKQEVIYNVDK